MDFWLIVNLIAQSLFTCPHTRAKVVEGKTFCPDCGKGVIFRWVAIKCTNCNQRRPTDYWFRQVIAKDICCTYCGQQETEKETLEDPQFYQLHHALLSFETDKDDASLYDRVWAVVNDKMSEMKRRNTSTQTPYALIPSCINC